MKKTNQSTTHDKYTTDQLQQQIATLENDLAQARQQQVFLQTILDALPQAIFWKDPQLVYQGCNRAFATVAGVGAPAQIVGKTDQDLAWKPEEAEFFRTIDQRVITSDAAERDIIEPQQQVDGKQAWLRTSKIPLHDAQGQVVGILGTFDDATAQVQRERELEAVFNSSYQFIGLLRPDGMLLKVNRAVIEATGVRLEDTGSLHFADAPWWPTDTHRAEVRAAIARAAAGDHVQYQTSVVVANNLRLDIDFALRPVQDETGAVIFLLAEGHDITAQKQSEAELRVYQQVIEQALDGIAIVNPNGVITYANAAYNCMLGYESAVGLTNGDVTPSDNIDRVAEVGNHIMQHGAYQGHYRYLHADGSTFPAQLSVFLIDDNPNADVFAAAIIRDITEQVEREHELRRSEARQRALLDAMPDMMFVLDSEGTYIDYWGAPGDSFIPPEQFLGKRNEDILPVELAQQFLETITQVLRTRKMQHIEYAVPAGDSVFFYEARVSAIDDTTALALVRNITERKHAEQQLRLTQFTLERAADSVIWVTRDEAVVYANDAACTLLGYTHEELRSLRLDDVDPYFTEEHKEPTWQQLRERGVLRFEGVHRHKDGHDIPVEVLTNYLAFEGQVYACIFSRDITERKRQEEDLRIFKILAENTPDGVTIVDMQTNIQYANSAYKTMTGYGEDIIGMQGLRLAAEEDLALAQETLQKLPDDRSMSLSMTYRRKDGSTFPVDISVFLIEDDNGQALLAGFVRDMTEQKRAETERAALQQQVIEAQRATLRELSTPIIPITDTTMVMPLIGTIDSQRAQQVMEALLMGVSNYHANLVILDITGVPIVDTQVAQAFIQAAQAVKLLGAQVMLTGIQPQIAQTLVHLGVDLRGIQTCGSLQAGIAAALHP